MLDLLLSQKKENREMKKMLFFLGTLMGVILLASLPAKALTYHITFDSSVFDLSANAVINGTNDVLSITGFVTGPNGGAITGLNPGDPSWSIDNKLFPASTPVVTNGGILFDAAGWTYNLYSVGTSLYYLSTFNPDNTWFNPGIEGKVSVNQVPLPPALLLFGAGLLGLSTLGRSKGRQRLAT